MSRISATFNRLAQENKKGLIPFITAGFPKPAITVSLMHALVKGGADIIELGVPFSDPMADGPVIQRANEIALSQGMSLTQVLNLVSEFRKDDAQTPIVLMGYANPIEKMGPQHFVHQAQIAGVDGVLVVDYPPEECAEFAAQTKVAGIDLIFLIAPTTTESRMAQIAILASGYVYYVSLKGVTGAGHVDTQAVYKKMPLIRKHVKIPVGVGFGIRDEATARSLSESCDAVIIGSRLITELENCSEDDAPKSLQTLLNSIRLALDQ